jgi:hypothetical protein
VDDESRRRENEGMAFREEFVAGENQNHEGELRGDKAEDDEARRREAEGAEFDVEFKASQHEAEEREKRLRQHRAEGRVLGADDVPPQAQERITPHRLPPATAAPVSAPPTATAPPSPARPAPVDCRPLPANSKIASAVSRATTDACRGALKEAYCSMEAGTLLPKMVPYAEPCVNFSMTKAVDTSTLAEGSGATRPARLAFVLVAYQAGMFEQLKLVFHLLYRPQHWFLFHIDARSDLLITLVQELLVPYPNAEIAPFAFPTIWGTSQLYKMYLRCISHLLGKGDWDFFINLSEADMPIKSIDSVARELGHVRGTSFLTSSATMKEKRFCEKQGVNFTFFQCDNHLFAIGKRVKQDDVMKVKGGSDWYAAAPSRVAWRCASLR